MGGGRGGGGRVVKDEIRNFQNKLLDVCAARALREEDAPGQNWEMSQGHFLKVENLKDFSEGNFEVNEQIWTAQTLSSNTAAWHHSAGCWSLGLFQHEVSPLLLRNQKKKKKNSKSFIVLLQWQEQDLMNFHSLHEFFLIF